MLTKVVVENQLVGKLLITIFDVEVIIAMLLQIFGL